MNNDGASRIKGGRNFPALLRSSVRSCAVPALFLAASQRRAHAFTAMPIASSRRSPNARYRISETSTKPQWTLRSRWDGKNDGRKKFRSVRSSDTEYMNDFVEEARGNEMEESDVEGVLFVASDQETMSSSAVGDGMLTVLYAASLITANTVGSSILTLPDVVSRSGIAVSGIVFLVVLLINLVTSFYISDLSIEQFEAGRSGTDVPTSFKDIADEAFGSFAGYSVAALSVMFNYCIIIFNVIRFGDTFGEMVPGLDPTVSSLGFAAALTALIATCTNVQISKITSLGVVVLFASFVGLLLPGISHASWDMFISQSGGYFHGTGAGEIMASLITSAPIIVYCMEIQKIVPSVAKLCNFDRFRTRTSVAVGASIPMAMYMVWCFMILGGGIDVSGSHTNFLLPVFTIASVCGCTIAGAMSISEEFESLLAIMKEKFIVLAGTLNMSDRIPTSQVTLKNNSQDIAELSPSYEDGQSYSLPAVLFSVVPPLLIGLHLSNGENGEGVVEALDFAGGYLTPLFIWIFPAMLAWKRLSGGDGEEMDEKEWPDRLRSGWDALSIVSVLLCSFGVIALELTKDFGDMFHNL